MSKLDKALCATLRSLRLCVKKTHVNVHGLSVDNLPMEDCSIRWIKFSKLMNTKTEKI